MDIWQIFQEIQKIPNVIFIFIGIWISRTTDQKCKSKHPRSGARTTADFSKKIRPRKIRSKSIL